MSRTFRFIAVPVFLSIIAVAAQDQAPTAADQFYAAIRGGDVGQVRALLQGGADVNAADRRGGATPLMNATAFGSLETMQLLIDRGANVNARNTGGATALMWAVTDVARVKLLIEHGADVNVRSEGGRSALMLAAMSDGSAEIVRLLLARGADPRVVSTGDQITTVNAATLGNDAETIRILADAGADVNAADFTGGTPLMNAASNGNLAAVTLLLAKGARVNAVSGEPALTVKNGVIQLGRFTALAFAAPFGPPDVVKALVAAGANVNVQEARGMTPLMLAQATDHGDLAITRFLLASGANVNVKSMAGETALDWAQKSSATSAVDLLKRAGAMNGAGPSASVPAPAPVALRPAVERSVALLERSSGTFFVNGACGACHAQNVTDIATSTARRHGVPIDEVGAARRLAGASGVFTGQATKLLERFDGPALDILMYSLGGFASGAYKADRGTDALAFNIAAQQARSGNWHFGGIARPPIEDGDFARTALGIRGLKTYGPPGRGAEMRERIARAVAWLQAARPITTEDRSFRMLGLAWGGADAAVVRAAAADLVSTQRRDGGWSQRSEMSSDAYATGLAMFALRESGARTGADAAILAGAKYLLSTQRGDGSWYVRSRSPKFQPYFEGGFPYGPDQWISSMATGWATAALVGLQ